MICAAGSPASVVACDSSPSFIEYARSTLGESPASFLVAGADSLPHREGGFDFVVSGLVLNFLPDAKGVMSCILDRLRPQGTVAAYVWDYANGMELLRIFWEEACAEDVGAVAVDERHRFGLCSGSALRSLFEGTGLVNVYVKSLQVRTVFSTFDDYWTPFLRGTGPAPSYVATLDGARRDSLRERLRRRLHAGHSGPIRLSAQAIAVRGSMQ
jgi:SAM-dependent methyltransferase